ncbi:MAG: adenylate/guanylate cyclase domain-containing protein [Verrucomicrobiota bacterium]
MEGKHQPSAAATRAREGLVSAAICLGITVLVGVLDFTGFSPLWKTEIQTQDLRQRLSRPAPLDPQLVFLAINKPDYSEELFPEDIAASPVLAGMSGWPWSREVHAQIIERLAASGARVIAYDMLFLSPGNGDDALARSAERHKDKLVLGALVSKPVGTETEQLFVPAPILGEGAEGEILASRKEGRLGFINFWADEDGTVRRAEFSRTIAGQTGVSFAARILEKAGQADKIPAEPRRLRFAGPPYRNYQTIPINELFLPRPWTNRFQSGAFFRDKIVIIGPLGEWAKDVLPTIYLNPMPGPEMHLAAVGAARHGAFFRESGQVIDFLCILGAGLVVIAVTRKRRNPIGVLLFLVAVAAAYGGTVFVIQDRAGYILPAVAPVLNLVACGIFSQSYAFLVELRQKLLIKRMFATMVSDEVLQYMMADPDRFRLTGERRQATMFFSDLAGFTTISESLTPDNLAKVLNRYLSPMSDIILRYGGYIDKYEGDAIMADFGVPVWTDADAGSHAWKACWAALEQLEELEKLRPQLKAEYGCDIDMRIGINTGWVAAGNMGSEKKFQYTVMGDAVNQAARFEPANKLFGTRILIGEETFKLAEERIEARLVAALVVKGKTQPVKIYELLAKKGELPDTRRAVVRHFENGWRLYGARQFAEAIAEFDAALKLAPEDGPSLTYKDLAEQHLHTPPPEGWAGEFVQTSK